MVPGSSRSRIMLIVSMCIFSTIGLLRRFIPYDSSFIALVRGFVGALFLLLVMLVGRKPMDLKAVRANAGLLLVSGAAIGFNWIFLFEAYRYTTVAVATLCYYLAPVLVILFSSLLLKEPLTPRKLVCTGVSLLGMVMVSGVLDGQGVASVPWTGIVFGVAAAGLYAFVILLNKKMAPVPAYDKTVIQLSAASLALLPYVLLTGGMPSQIPGGISLILLAVAGIVHTGIAYCLYFGSMSELKAHTIAMLSYLDPVIAVFLSLIVLGEPMSLLGGIGAVLVLGAAYICEKS